MTVGLNRAAYLMGIEVLQLLCALLARLITINRSLISSPYRCCCHRHRCHHHHIKEIWWVKEKEADQMVRPGRGQRRIDAAIDHLSEYGFPRPIIRQTINELLADTLYGRNGWVFLEEGSYRIVVDRLLEKQANQQEQQEEDAKGYFVNIVEHVLQYK
uniref:WIYLD domain-containing protein n=1 Tax=Oryza sativa subsp. japonica TaxID=39947 RepID=Q6YYV2_ORYSJ|nr:hypothetical protein [Oryza sativa Japonica Group]